MFVAFLGQHDRVYLLTEKGRPMEQLLEAKDTISVDGVVSLADGGTSATTAPRAAENLGMILQVTVGRPLGPVPVDAITRKIPPEYFTGIGSYRAEVNGNKVIPRGSTQTYDITNFDSRYDYNVTAVFGTVVLNDDKIVYTSPQDRTHPAGFFLNGESWPLTIGANTPLNPLFAQSVVRDKKSFTSRSTASPSLSLSATTDFNRIVIADASATVGGALKAGHFENFDRSGNSLARGTSHTAKTPALTVVPYLGKVSGAWSASSDATGWVNGSSNVSVGDNSTFFEATLIGGSNKTLSLVKGVINPEYVDGYSFFNGTVYVTYQTHLTTLADDVALYAGNVIDPIEVDLGNGLFLYIPIQARLLAGDTRLVGYRYSKVNDVISGFETLPVTLTAVADSDNVTYSDGTHTGVMLGSWRIHFVESTTTVLKSLNSYLKIGTKVIMARGQLTDALQPETTVLNIKTQTGANFGYKSAVAGLMPGFVYTVTKTVDSLFGSREYLEIFNSGSVVSVQNPTGVNSTTGFGSFVSVSDSGTSAIVGEPDLNFGRVHVFDNLGVNKRIITSPVAASLFGTDGDISKDGLLAAICAPFESTGVVYVYTLNNVSATPIQISNPLTNGYVFGYKAKFNRNKTRLFITAMDPVTEQGVVLVYSLLAGVATRIATLEPYDTVKGFGKDISPSGSGQHVLIGVPGDDLTEGQAQVWFEGDTEWEMSHRLIPDEVVTGGHYGSEVLLSDDALVALVAAPSLRVSSTSFGRTFMFS